MDTPPTRYVLTIRSRPSAYPEAVRLRHVLKRLLRQFDFVCTSIEEVKPAAPAAVDLTDALPIEQRIARRA